MRGQTQKRFCLLRTRSPHSNLSQPPLDAWCAERVHPNFPRSGSWGMRPSFPLYSPSFRHQRARMCGDTLGSLLQRFRPRAGHLSVQHFTFHQPEQGRRGLSFVVEGAAASRPSRHPISDMSSFARHSASSIAFHS